MPNQTGSAVVSRPKGRGITASLFSRKNKEKPKTLPVPKFFIFMCMLPWILGFVGFTLYPIIVSFYNSFTKFNLVEAPEWIGLDNYKRAFFEDELFWQALRNTIWITVVSIPIRIGFSMMTAWLLTKPRQGRGLYRTIFFVPSMVPTVAATLVFTFLFHPAFGPINGILEKFGVENPPEWFQDPAWSKWGLIFLGLWGIGDTMIIFLAGMLDIDRSLYESASVEGANGFQQFRYITLPLMTPVIFFSGVTGVIGSFQYFTQAYVVTSQSGVNDFSNSMYFFATHIYREAFTAYEMGYASALAWILLVITLVCTLIILKTQKRWVHYPNGSLF